MKLPVRLITEEIVVFDFEFPIYRKHILDNSTIFSKVESATKEIKIHINDVNSNVEIEIEEPRFYGSKDYILGEGEYKSNEKEFNLAISKSEKIVNDLNQED